MDGREIVVVHGQHQIETREIIEADLSCAAGQLNAATVGCSLHASVRRIAHMPSARSGGIHHELITEATLLKQMQEDAFCRWRAADVAKADEQQFLGHPALRRWRAFRARS